MGVGETQAFCGEPVDMGRRDLGRVVEATGIAVSEVVGDIRMLAAFVLMAVAAGAVLFRFVVED